MILSFYQKKNENIRLESVFKAYHYYYYCLYKKNLFFKSGIVCTTQYVKWMELICKILSHMVQWQLESIEHCPIWPPLFLICAIYMFIWKFFIEHILRARNSYRHWRYCTELGKDVHSWLLCVSSSWLQDPTEYKRKRGVKDDSIVFVLSNCRDGLVIKYKVG